jgi:hypothetical protein
MLDPQALMLDLAATSCLAAVGVVGVWVMRRRTTLSIRNLYLPAAVGVAAIVVCSVLQSWDALLVALPLTAPWIAAAIAGRRWRLVDLGAGEELRNHELFRRWVWEPAPARTKGERIYLRSQGELVHERPWPAQVEHVSMTALGERGPRLPLGEGQHVALFGASGAGKTTTARRLVVERTLSQRAALFVLDQKGDENDIAHMRRLAAAAGVPFIIFDSQDLATDRWQPLWGTADKVAARAVEPIKQSEPYYYDVLRRHLDIVCKVLHAADRWPPSIPLLVDSAQPVRYPDVLAIAQRLGPEHRGLARRARDHGRYVSSTKGTEDLSGGAFRLEVALALASRSIVTPRLTSEREAVAVRLVEALEQRAVVMWRTHADTMPDEAAALSVLALADLHDAVEQGDAPWTLLLDEFGAVINMAAARGVAMMQRGRSHHGQVIVITQSTADIEALSQQPGLLESLTDNFTGVVAHRQTSPGSRDWLAKLMGTRAIWQSTNQTASHGTQHSGRGSARRAREFRVGSDTFSELVQGEAVLYTVHGPDPARAEILPVYLAHREPERIDQAGPRHACEITVHPEESLPDHTPKASQQSPTSHTEADSI